MKSASRQRSFSDPPRGQGVAIVLILVFALSQLGIFGLAAVRYYGDPSRRVAPQEVAAVTEQSAVESELPTPPLPERGGQEDLLPPVPIEVLRRPAGSYAVPPPPPLHDEPDSTAGAEGREEAAGPDEEALGEEPIGEGRLPPIENRDAAVLVESAILAESEQDLARALSYLRGANRREPNHPAILYRMGVIYHQLGNQSQAQVYFQLVKQMGEEKAGELYSLASHYLSGQDPNKRLRGPGDRPFRLGKAESSVTTSANGDRQIKVSVNVRLAASEEIDPGAVNMEIRYYDLIDGKRAKQLFGNLREPQWASEFPDWVEPSEELVDIVFDIPDSSEDSEGEAGEFFGFILKLYYDDEIQDVIASPRILPEIVARQQEPYYEESMLDATLFGE